MRRSSLVIGRGRGAGGCGAMFPAAPEPVLEGAAVDCHKRREFILVRRLIQLADDDAAIELLELSGKLLVVRPVHGDRCLAHGNERLFRRARRRNLVIRRRRAVKCQRTSGMGGEVSANKWQWAAASMAHSGVLGRTVVDVPLHICGGEGCVPILVEFLECATLQLPQRPRVRA